VLLSGPHSEEVVPPSLYRRLAGGSRGPGIGARVRITAFDEDG
jgi:hypothetical protein